MKKSKKVLKVFAIIIAIAVLGCIIYGVGFMIHNEVVRRRTLENVSSDLTTSVSNTTANDYTEYNYYTFPQTTEPEFSEPEEFGFENIDNYDADSRLWISVNSVDNGYVYTRYREDEGIQFYRGMLFEGDNVVTSVRNIKSSENYQVGSSLRYSLVNNNQITYLGLDEYNNDLIIVKRVLMKTLSDSDGALLLKCTECGDEMFYMLASSIDWSSGKVVTKDGREMVRYTLL